MTSFLAGLPLLRPARTTSPPRYALLLGAPWKGETWLGNGIGKMQAGLAARGFTADEITASAEPLNRVRLLRHLADLKRRVASWREGTIFLHYDGHGMYRAMGGPVPEPGLQLTGERDDPSSAVLWSEVWRAVAPPTGVRLIAIPDCCHTNLLTGRLPRNVTALILRSEPQNALTCRTGGSYFGEGAGRKRYGVISYYASHTVAQARTVDDWLAAINRAVAGDVAQGALDAVRRPGLLVEGDGSVRLPEQAKESVARTRGDL